MARRHVEEQIIALLKEFEVASKRVSFFGNEGSWIRCFTSDLTIDFGNG